jgi:hypothetical protein
MPRSRVEEIVRHFRENGLKLLLQRPANARDLLSLAGAPHLDRLDFARMRVDPTSYIASDYRHLASDLVLQLPFRQGSRRRSLTLYVLIEHQSEFDALMLLRLHDYLIQIYKGQLRAWESSHRSPAGFRLQPVLPVVLYTGTRPWPALGRLADLLEGAEWFPGITPEFTPLFVSLPALGAVELETRGGYFGWIQQRKTNPEAFRQLVVRVVQHIEELPPTERERWLELLSYIQALVYHDRAEAEREELRQVIVASVQTDERRQETETMTRTIAEALREEGRREGELRSRQQMLVRLLRARYKKVPKAMERTVLATEDLGRLDTWILRFATATTLDEIGIQAEP